MTTYNRPDSLPNWCKNNETNCTAVPQSLSDAGFTQGSVPVAEYENSYRRNVGLWLGYLDQAATKQTLTSTLNFDLRLLGGGSFTYTSTTQSLAWDDTLYLAVPGIPQADNAIAAGSVTLGPQTMAYVAANIPFQTTGQTTNGDANVQQVLSTSAIAVGQSVSGQGIALGTTVRAINDTTITLSQPATATNQAATLTFVSSGALTVQSTPVSSFTPAANTVVLALGLDDSVVVGANSGQMRVRPLEQKRLLGTGFANTIRVPAGQSLNQTTACFIANGQNSTTAGAAYPTDASGQSAAQKALFAGFVSNGVAQGGTCHLVSNGVIGGFLGLTIGAVYYLNPTVVGGITPNKPTSSGQYSVPVGFAVSTTQIQVNPGASAQALQVAAVPRLQQVYMGGLYVQAGYSFTNNAGHTETLVDLKMPVTLAGNGNVSNNTTRGYTPGTAGSVVNLQFFATIDPTQPLDVALSRNGSRIASLSNGFYPSGTGYGMYLPANKGTWTFGAFDSLVVSIGLGQTLPNDIAFFCDITIDTSP